MKKRILAAILATLMVAGLVACGGDTSAASTTAPAASSGTEASAANAGAADGEVVLNLSSNISHTTWDTMNTHSGYHFGFAYDYFIYSAAA